MIRPITADETRPLLQGSRITAYELQHAGVPVTVTVVPLVTSALASAVSVRTVDEPGAGLGANEAWVPAGSALA